MIVSDEFKNLSNVKRHKEVYKVLGEVMQSIHALSIHSFDNEEYKNNPMILDSPNCVNK